MRNNNPHAEKKKLPKMFLNENKMKTIPMQKY